MVKGSREKGNKKVSSKILYISGFIVMLLGLLTSVWLHFLIGIGMFFGGIVLYMIGLTRRNNWNM